MACAKVISAEIAINIPGSNSIRDNYVKLTLKNGKKTRIHLPSVRDLNTRKERLHFFMWQPIQEKEIPEWCHTARVGFSLYPRMVMPFTISEAALTTWHFTQLLHSGRNGESVGEEHYILLLLVCAVSLQGVDDHGSPPCSVASSSSAISPKSHPLRRTRIFNCFWRMCHFCCHLPL